MFLLIIIYQFLTFADAWTDRKGNVNHLRGAILYATGGALVALLFIHRIPWYHIALCLLLTRAAFFDVYLNLLRGKPFSYNGDATNPKRSLIDKLEDWTGLSVFWLRVIYIAAYLTHIIIYYATNN